MGGQFIVDSFITQLGRRCLPANFNKVSMVGLQIGGET
jgi:hypothetical protein